MLHKSKLVSLDRARHWIGENRVLAIFGPENLLNQLPKGSWIAGVTTMIYGNKELDPLSGQELLVCDFSDIAMTHSIKAYSRQELQGIDLDGYESGFCFLISPSRGPLFDALYEYALRGFTKPVTGIVAGCNFSEPVIREVLWGFDSDLGSDRAVAIHVKLPKDRKVRIVSMNMFEPKSKPIIEVLSNSSTVNRCLIDGVEQNLLGYFRSKNIDPRFPLMFLQGTSHTNVSVKEVLESTQTLTYNAPLIKGRRYYTARAFDNYPYTLRQRVRELLKKETSLFFSCNGFRNFLDGELSKGLPGMVGVAGMAEIAQQVHSQTFTFVTIDEYALLSFSGKPERE